MRLEFWGGLGEKLEMEVKMGRNFGESGEAGGNYTLGCNILCTSKIAKCWATFHSNLR